MRAVVPELPGALERLVLPMLAKEAAARPSAGEVAAVLRTFDLRGIRKQGRTSLFAIAAALALLVIVGSFLLSSILRHRTAPPPEVTLAFLTGNRGLERNPATSPDGNRVVFDYFSVHPHPTR